MGNRTIQYAVLALLPFVLCVNAFGAPRTYSTDEVVTPRSGADTGPSLQSATPRKTTLDEATVAGGKGSLQVSPPKFLSEEEMKALEASQDRAVSPGETNPQTATSTRKYMPGEAIPLQDIHPVTAKESIPKQPAIPLDEIATSTSGVMREMTLDEIRSEGGVEVKPIRTVKREDFIADGGRWTQERRYRLPNGEIVLLRGIVPGDLPTLAVLPSGDIVSVAPDPLQYIAIGLVILATLALLAVGYFIPSWIRKWNRKRRIPVSMRVHRYRAVRKIGWLCVTCVVCLAFAMVREVNPNSGFGYRVDGPLLFAEVAFILIVFGLLALRFWLNGNYPRPDRVAQDPESTCPF